MGSGRQISAVLGQGGFVSLSSGRHSDRPSVRGVAEAGEPQSGPADRDDPERNGRRFGVRARFAQIARVLSPSSGVSNVPFFDEKAGYYSVRIVAE